MSNVKAPPTWLTPAVSDQAIAWMDGAANWKAEWSEIERVVRAVRRALRHEIKRSASPKGGAPRTRPNVLSGIRVVAPSYSGALPAALLSDLPDRPCVHCGSRGWCGHAGRVRP